MTEHRIVLVERSNERSTPDETVIELTVRHGQCSECQTRLYDKNEAIVITMAHIDGSYRCERYCSIECVAHSYMECAGYVNDQ